MDLKEKINLWLPVIVWCGFIFALSSIPTLPKVGFIWWDFILKKSAHILEYAVLFYLLSRALRGRKNAFWISLVFGLVYAVLDEFHQSFVPGRSSRVYDVGFDLAGMLSVFWYIRQKERRIVNV